jgi:voltage-gated potassium channel
MKKLIDSSPALWNTLLLASLIFTLFILPMLPSVVQVFLLRPSYTFICLSAILSLDKRNKYTLGLFFVTLVFEWISAAFNLQVLQTISKLANILYFLVIVVSLIGQIASSRKVTSKIILGSVAGYMLLGLIFSIFVIFISQNDPAAFSASLGQTDVTEDRIDASGPFYFSLVTLTTLGYGDIVPLKPYTRSLATFIAITGQLYIAVIVALLVGKFSAQQHLPDI